MSIGIICEYNPFHNGHLYHLKKIREKYQEEDIVLILGGNFLQRGITSIIEKYDKTKIALEYGISLVIELPFPFATQGADLFAKGSIELLKYLKCDKLIFGSETNDVKLLKKLANIQLYNDKYNELIKEYLKEGINYPTALSKALKETGKVEIEKPNDILALSYIREIIKQEANIEPISIKRTNDYNSNILENEISSGKSIREAYKSNQSIDTFMPYESIKYLINNNYDDKYYDLLKYKIITEREKISKYQTVDEGIENRILKFIDKSNSLEELINNIKTKRYTYNKISRMLTHILVSFTKEEASKNKKIKYIRVLGFNKQGKEIINKIKNNIDIPIITNINKNNINLLDIEIREDQIYNIIIGNNKNIYETKPIIKR